MLHPTKTTCALFTLLGLSCTPSGGLVPVGETETPDTGSRPTTDDTGLRSWPACQPRAELADPYYLEGDQVSFSFSCGNGADPAEFEASLASAPPGSQLSDDEWRFTWATGFSDGGRQDVMISVRSKAAVAAGADVFPETGTGTFWVADNWESPQNVPPVPAEYTEEWALPVFHVTVDGSLDTTYTTGTVTAWGKSYDVDIKVRGAVSVSYPKQSYTIRFGDVDLDASAVGLGNKDHLYLITPFDDNSYVRQKLVYDMWLQMAEYWGAERLTPRTFFGVVYLNGSYHGLYTFCDRIDDHFAQEMGLSSAGNLYKAVDHDANFYRTSSSGGSKSTLHDGYEKKEGEPLEGEANAFWDLEELVAFSADSDDFTFFSQADAWIRVDEFMDWLLLVHYTAAHDSAGKNSYLYNNPDDWEFRFCPWDFNHSYGQGWYTYRISSSDYNDFQSYNGIFNHFLDYPETSTEVWDRLREMMSDGGPMSLEWQLAELDAYFELMDISATRDWSVWGPSYQSYWGSYNSNDYEQEKAYLYQWVEERDGWMWTYHSD